LPYIYPTIHDVIYTEPPGTMYFSDDWGLDFNYDEVNNPNPIREIDFMTDLTFTDRAAPQSLKYGIPVYYEIGFIWLHRGRRVMEGISPLRLERQIHFNGERQQITSYDADNNYELSFPTDITLEFNTALISSVRLICHPPPVWVDP